MIVKKIISGGQTGADTVALEVGMKLDIKTGGYAPKNFMTENGPNFKLRDIYGLEETKSTSYPERTKLNVDESDGTLVFRYKDSIGTDCTIGYAQTGEWKKGRAKHNSKYKPVCVIDGKNDELNIKLIKNFIHDNNINVLNVAGHRESGSPFPEYCEYVKNILYLALKN